MAKSETSEPTIESLQQALAEKTADLLEKQTALDAATTQLAQSVQNLDQVASQLIVTQTQLEQSQAELAATKQALAAKQAELAEAGTVLSGQAATILTLQSKIDKLNTKPNTAPAFTYNGKTYEVQAATFKLSGVTYTRDQLLRDVTLQGVLVEKKVGFIVELV